ncbi:phospholipid carrier-dependent glycosyltransferase [Phytohabitans sp. ZYX-F-186]|uniref:Phospholipid carrier-dependent glycosyltransferase n=1 Tax=Phytohabitans maris TaxID=3071409 RepID=A0ABU0ZN04_9ACTN|nr:phospholipid carrier-dependent glycosyltransferase [Phytohabitans sp. ZYX-F-186]MDQ7908411.1 phospholipid carrier-dependent glycosyltransferase [Phytohabitans sp. ZYX-F-186]
MTATLSRDVEAQAAPADRLRRGRLGRLARLLRRHSVFLALILLGGVLRALFMLSYKPAFWYFGDSGVYITMSEAKDLYASPTRALGYVVALKLLEPTHTFMSLIFLQHLAGLVLAAAMYAFLQHRGAPRWLSCLAIVPVLFDSLFLTVEHYLLPDQILTFCIGLAIIVVLWDKKPRWWAAGLAGLLLACAWFTKPTALPLVVLVGLLLLVRWAGWRSLVAYAITFLIPYLLVMNWIGDRQSVYGSQSGIALYGRAAMIADCSRIDLTFEEQTLCPTRHFDRADAYFWTSPPKRRYMAYTADGAKLYTDFSMAVIRQQPGDYLRSVGKESLAHFVPGFRLGPDNDCLRLRWTPPEGFRDTLTVPNRCYPSQARGDYQKWAADPKTGPKPTAVTEGLHWYGKYVRLIPSTLSISLLLVLATLISGLRFFRWRLPGPRAPGRIKLDVVVLLVAGTGLTILTVAIGMYEARYAMPALPLASLGAALAIFGLTSGRLRPAPPADPSPAADEEEEPAEKDARPQAS